MNPEDVKALAMVREELMKIADLIEGDFQRSDSTRHVNMYAIVYSASTRTRVNDSDKQYAAQEELYNLFQEYLSEAIVRNSRDISRMNRDDIYTYAIAKWAKFKILKKWSMKTFRYLSSFYIEHCNKQPLEYVALSIFFNQVYKRVSTVLRNVLMSLVMRERKGELVAKDQMTAGVELILSMGFEESSCLPDSEFVEPLLRETAQYYSRESTLAVSVMSSIEYLKQAEIWLADEAQRAHRLLPSEQLQKALVNVAEHEILAVHQSTLLNRPTTGFVALLVNRHDEHIKMMYSMFARLKAHGLDPMAALLKTFCVNECQSIPQTIASTAAPGSDPDFKAYVTGFIALHEKYMTMLAQLLGNNVAFQTAIKDAFEAVINQGLPYVEAVGAPPTKTPAAELVANYADHILKSGAEKMGDDDLEALLINIVGLVTRISDKDLFHEYSRRLLSKRLLTSTVFYEEAEKLFITKLKAKFGASSTSRLDSMINDRAQSIELNKTFRDFCEKTSDLPSEVSSVHSMEFYGQILTTGVWPPLPVDQVALPTSVRMMMEAFRRHYITGKSQRILQWVNCLGNVTILATYGSRDYQLTMSVFQACILLLFNQHASLTLSEVQQQTNMDWDEVKRVIQSFCHSKVKLLNRTGDASMRDTDVISVKEDFTNPQKKIKVPVAMQRITAQQTAVVAASVAEDRRPAIEACIVRVMKSRRQEEHSQLVAEVIKQLASKFTPDPKTIKQRIEELIHREYLERDPTNASMYVYIA